MNRNGVFIAFMIFLLAGSVLVFYNATKRLSFMEERKDIEAGAFNSVNNAFNNIYEDVVSLNKEGYASEVQQRPMPFSYSLGGNSLVLSQRLPVRENTLNAYIDALNIYSIFANSDNATRDLQISTETVSNGQWDSQLLFPDLNYAILPQCILYDVNLCCADTNMMALRELQPGQHGCTAGFDYNSIGTIDVNILVDSGECAAGSISGNLAGREEAFNPSETRPYFRITINETGDNCPGSGCIITGGSGKELAFGHFDPETFEPADQIDSLLVNCDSQEWLRVKLGMESGDDDFPVAVYNRIKGKPAEVDLNLTFSREPELFYFTGFSANVEKKNFLIKRST